MELAIRPAFCSALAASYRTSSAWRVADSSGVVGAFADDGEFGALVGIEADGDGDDVEGDDGDALCGDGAGGVAGIIEDFGRCRGFAVAADGEKRRGKVAGRCAGEEDKLRDVKVVAPMCGLNSRE